MNKHYKEKRLLSAVICLLALLVFPIPPATADPGREVYAEVVALDQSITYNRFGSYNPYGMMYALKRDVVDTENCNTSTDLPPDKEHCQPMSASTKPGNVRLRKDLRPRPLVLRASPGDQLQIKFFNMLAPNQPDFSSPNTPKAYTEASLGLTYTGLGLPEPIEPIEEVEPKIPTGEAATKGCGSELVTTDPIKPAGRDWPRSRCASLSIAGMTPAGDANDPLVTGLQPIAPGQTYTYTWKINLPEAQKIRRTTHLFFSHGAPAGGQGDGGSLVHGLFGALHVEPEGSQWYRSQVSDTVFQQAQDQRKGNAFLNYQAKSSDGTPLLAMLKLLGAQRYELIYGDINAIIVEKSVDNKTPPAFREFTSLFHDELKTFYADQFKELGTEFSLSGIGDGFAINYGASGAGAIVLANRKGIGPAKECINCAYEEFFLESWANGDPALLVDFKDDPSNVHHSYLNDRVEFRNLHAGPKETHVFHLHAHQWLSQESDTGSYLDSQTIGPQQGFSYPILYGGSGNRNRTPGDSIYHCHLYPHFAQGMWALWRVHDVLEDGTRRLPDGERGAGTNLSSGVTDATSGTPIPAVVPLPQQAMPPAPTYGDNGFPGYPFYIAGEAGQRPPQAPNDIAKGKDAGLPRHVLLAGGERTISGLKPEERVGMTANDIVQHALRTGDFSNVVDVAKLKTLPDEGTPLELTAMAFHSKGEHASTTPEGIPKAFKVNDKPAKPGAPFADPCTGDTWKYSKQYTRTYEVSAIQLDLSVNKAGWHDPQARINVLDSDVDKYSDKEKSYNAEPFFFRANSGDCIEFHHTNRTPEVLDLDDFQVKTPTDTIGQHIHLVKFDVTASDGSGNGFNYEDGTFAKEEIKHIIGATQQPGGSVIKFDGSPDALSTEGKSEYQTTIQRWYADPLLKNTEECIQALETKDRELPNATEAEKQAAWDKVWQSEKCLDRTLRTVFTHDHFGPSSIQQHGFYSALLIEPRYSKFLKRDGSAMPEQAVGSEAMIIHTGDYSGKDTKPQDYREFALAVADFALLYDNNKGGTPPDRKIITNLTNQLAAARPSGDTKRISLLQKGLDAVTARYNEINKDVGKPIHPPTVPEGISKDHHDPYLVNYKHEPIPLRLGCDSSNTSCSSVNSVLPGDKGKMSYVFNSRKHGDPATPILMGYEGENVQLRMIQGAQEVQHSFNLNGQTWSREINIPRNKMSAAGLVSAQEIGISEHFEMQMGLDTIFHGDAFTDYLYHFGSVDDLWNGAWGLMRSISTQNISVDNCTGESRDKCIALFARLNCGTEFSAAKLAACISPLKKHKAQTNIANSPTLDAEQDIQETFDPDTLYSCPKNAPNVHYVIAAVDVSEWLGHNVSYGNRLEDPDSLAFVVLERQYKTPATLTNAEDAKDKLEKLKTYHQHHPLEPLVLRANTGDCIRVDLFNLLPQTLADQAGDAPMPKIVPLNVDAREGSAEDNVKPDNRISLHAQKVFYTIDANDGTEAGWNSEERGMTKRCSGSDATCRPTTHYWYAGSVMLDNCNTNEPSRQCLKVQPKEFGAANLTSFGDIINHPVHGLFGGLMVEPQNAHYQCLDATGQVDMARHALTNDCGIRAKVDYPDNGIQRTFKEFVVFYRDGLNLHQATTTPSTPVPDCLICDDSYDWGEKGINYSTEPFWTRLAQHPLTDLNSAYFPENFFLPSYKPVATPTFVAHAGDAVRFRVLQPHGRARQRAFMVYGHQFEDMLPEFGSPNAPLISVGKAITANIAAANPGVWQYRDGPNQMWSSGAWGIFEVKP